VQWKGEQPFQQLAVTRGIEPFHAEPRHEIHAVHGCGEVIARVNISRSDAPVALPALLMMLGAEFRQQDFAARPQTAQLQHIL